MSSPRFFFVLVAVGFLVTVGSPTDGRAQPDSVRTAILQEKGFSPDHSPRGALWRSAAVPGWGQVYNRQYYKLPFVYGGIAALGYTIHMMDQNYTLYRHAAIFARGQRLENQGEDPPSEISDWQSYRTAYEDVVREAGGSTENLENLPLSASQLRQGRDKYRRWRDLSIVGTGLFYVLTLVDAYVSAHLLTFDVGDDLALDVRPTGGVPAQTGASLPSLTSEEGIGLHVRLRF